MWRTGHRKRLRGNARARSEFGGLFDWGAMQADLAGERRRRGRCVGARAGTIDVANTAATTPTASSKDLKLVGNRFDRFAKLIAKAARFDDHRSNFIIRNGDKALSIRIGTREPCGGIRQSAKGERVFLTVSYEGYLAHLLWRVPARSAWPGPSPVAVSTDQDSP